MSVISKHIAFNVYEQARRIAAQERAKASAAFFAAIGRKLNKLLQARHAPADVHLRFHRGGLWRGI